MIYVVVGYVLTAIFSTFPLITKLGNYLPGQPGDAYSYIWNVWIFKYQLLNGNNLFSTDIVMAPIGANLYFNTYAPLVSIFGLLFKNNFTLYLGILIILSVFMASFFMYLLSYKITGNKMASFIGGFIYGISPIIHSFIQSQHYYFLFASPFFPLGILFVINFLNTKKIRYLYLSIGLFWLVLLIDYYSAVLYSLLILIFIGLSENSKARNIHKYIVAGLVTIVLPFLLLFNFDKNFNQFTNFKQESNPSSSCNTNLADFLIPNKNSIFLSEMSNRMRGFSKTEINYDTPSYYLGWGVLIIAVTSIITNHKNKFVKTFTVIFIFFLVISLGTNIKIGDTTLLSGKATPFYYFTQIPVLSMLGCTIRFPIIMQLCISAIVAIYVSRHKNIVRVFVAILILTVFEYGAKNIEYSPTKVPAVYSKIALDDNKKTVLEMPSGITESIGAFGYDWSIQALHSQQMYWQTSYQKPRVGAYISRLTPDKYYFYRTEPVISDIFKFTSLNGTMPESDIPDDEIKNFLIKFNLGYIVLSPNSRQDEFSEFVEQEFLGYIKDRHFIDGFILYILFDIHS